MCEITTLTLNESYLPVRPVTHLSTRTLRSSYEGGVVLKIGFSRSPLSLEMWRTDCK